MVLKIMMDHYSCCSCLLPELSYRMVRYEINCLVVAKFSLCRKYIGISTMKDTKGYHYLSERSNLQLYAIIVGIDTITNYKNVSKIEHKY